MAITNTINTTDAVSSGACQHHKINQGDSYNIPVYLSTVEIQGGEEVLVPFTAADVPLLDKLKFNIGKCVEKEVDAADAWDDELDAFLFHLDQADTLKMRPGVYQFDCAVKFAGGDVVSINKKDSDGEDARIFIHILPSERKKVVT